jgi:hypothetical protein
MSQPPIPIPPRPKPESSLPHIYRRRYVIAEASKAVGYDVTVAELEDAYRCWERVSSAALAMYIDKAFDRAIPVSSTNPKAPAGDTVLGKITAAQIIRAARTAVVIVRNQEAAERARLAEAKRQEQAARAVAEELANAEHAPGDLVIVINRVPARIVERAADGKYVVATARSNKEYTFDAKQIERPTPADTPDTSD